MKARIATYLKVLGIIQLAGLNLGGVFWLAWANGVRAGKQSSRRWVIGIHSVYLGACMWLLVQWFLGYIDLSHLRVFGRQLEVGRLAVLGFILALVMVYGLPVAWLMSQNAKREFVDTALEPTADSAFSLAGSVGFAIRQFGGGSAFVR